jgi:hypothetical protein
MSTSEVWPWASKHGATWKTIGPEFAGGSGMAGGIANGWPQIVVGFVPAAAGAAAVGAAAAGDGCGCCGCARVATAGMSKPARTSRTKRLTMKTFGRRAAARQSPNFTGF